MSTAGEISLPDLGTDDVHFSTNDAEIAERGRVRVVANGQNVDSILTVVGPDGAPVESASVQYGFATIWEWAGSTNKIGTLNISQVVRHTGSFFVVKCGRYVPAYVRDPGEGSVDVELAISHSLKGRVMVPDGIEVSSIHAKVYAWRDDASPPGRYNGEFLDRLSSDPSILEGSVDADGSFRIEGVEPFASYTCRALADGFLSYAAYGVRSDSDEPVLQLKGVYSLCVDVDPAFSGYFGQDYEPFGTVQFDCRVKSLESGATLRSDEVSAWFCREFLGHQEHLAHFTYYADSQVGPEWASLELYLGDRIVELQGDFLPVSDGGGLLEIDRDDLKGMPAPVVARVHLDVGSMAEQIVGVDLGTLTFLDQHTGAAWVFRNCVSGENRFALPEGTYDVEFESEGGFVARRVVGVDVIDNMDAVNVDLTGYGAMTIELISESNFVGSERLMIHLTSIASDLADSEQVSNGGLRCDFGSFDSFKTVPLLPSSSLHVELIASHAYVIDGARITEKKYGGVSAFEVEIVSGQSTLVTLGVR